MMKCWLSFLFLLSLTLSACASSSAPAPYSPDTPSPAQINAPLADTPALTSVHFANGLDGWGVTETQIVRTNDGGITWYNVTPPGVIQAGYSVAVTFLDNLHVWLQAPDYNNFPAKGTLYRTSDGGLTWASSETPFSGADISFLDPQNGWALADLGVGAGSNAVAVFQTTDGGSTWAKRYTNDPNLPGAGDSLPLGGLKAGLAPVSMQTAFVYGVTYSSGTPYLYRTDDGGANWVLVSLPLPPGAENAELGIDRDQLQFLSPADGFLAMRVTGGDYQLAVYVTSDGGRTWSLTPTLIPKGGSADFLSAREVVIYNGEQFYVTRDAAATWTIVPPDVKFGDIFAGMDFTDTSSGWVLTLTQNNQRTLYRSGDGGLTWFPIVP
jgi:photosystem II stability/assembly factor-like uncharacterized protein